MGRRFRIERAVEIVAKGGTEGGFIAAIDGEVVGDRREVACCRRGQDAGDGSGFCLQTVDAGTGCFERLAQMAFRAAGFVERGFGRHCRAFGVGDGLFGDLDYFALFVRVGQSRDAVGDLGEFAGGIRHLTLEPCAALGQIADGAFQLVAAGGSLGTLGGETGEIALAVGKRRGSGLEGVLRLFGKTPGIGKDFLELGLFFRQSLDDFGIFRDEALLAADVLVELSETPGEFVAAAENPACFLVKLRTGDLQPLKGGSAFCLLLAQFRHLQARNRLQLGGLHLVVRLLGDQRHGLVQRAFGLALGPLRLCPADVQQHGVMGADIGRQLLEAIGLACLALEAFDLAFELGGDVFQPLQIGFGGAQSQFRLVAAGMQTGNAGGLFEQLPTRLGLGLDQFADAALADHGGRAGAGRGIGKQQLHILGAGFLAVDAIDRTIAALDAPRHLDLIGIVEGGRSRAVGIVEIKADLGRIAGGAIAGAGEDDVVHAGRTHVLVGVLAHDPTERFDEVRLAAAVRPDNAGQAAFDDEFGGFDERLEADDTQAVEFHRAILPFAPLAGRRWPEGPDERPRFTETSRLEIPPMSNESAPLCPAGHLPHAGGERRVAFAAVTAGVAYGASRVDMGRMIVTIEREASGFPLSPLVGEMPGRAEGGNARCSFGNAPLNPGARFAAELPPPSPRRRGEGRSTPPPRIQPPDKQTGARVSPAPVVRTERRSEQAVDEGRHGVNRHVPRIGLAIDQEGRSRLNTEFLSTAIADCRHITGKLCVRQAGVEGLLCKTTELGELEHGATHVTIRWSRPGALLLEQHGDEGEVFVFRGATGQHEGGERSGVLREGEFAQHEIDLAGVDILGLDRLEGVFVEVCAMRAGHRHVFDHLDRRIRIAERHFLERARLQGLFHIDIAIGGRDLGGRGRGRGLVADGRFGFSAGGLVLCVAAGGEREADGGDGNAAEQTALGDREFGSRHGSVTCLQVSWMGPPL